MSQFREGQFEGECVGENAELFERLDRGDVMLKTEAQKTCESCDGLQECRQELGALSISLANRGVDNTVIAGQDTQPRTFEFVPLPDEAEGILATTRAALGAKAISMRRARYKAPGQAAIIAAAEASTGLAKGLDVPRVARLASGAIDLYVRAAQDLGISQAHPDDEVMQGIGILFMRDMHLLDGLGLKRGMYSLPLYYDSQDVAGWMERYMNHPDVQLRHARELVKNFPSVGVPVVESYEARLDYARNVMQPRLLAELGDASHISDAAVREACLKETVNLEKGMRQRVTQQVEVSSEPDEIAARRQAITDVYGQVRGFSPGVINDIARRTGQDALQLADLYFKACQTAYDVIGKVDGPFWVASTIARWHYTRDSAESIAKIARANYLKLTERYEGNNRIRWSAALARFPFIEMELLLQKEMVRSNKLPAYCEDFALLRQRIAQFKIPAKGGIASLRNPLRQSLEAILETSEFEHLTASDKVSLAGRLAWYAHEVFEHSPDRLLFADDPASQRDALLWLVVDEAAFTRLRTANPRGVALRYSLSDYKRIVTRCVSLKGVTEDNVRRFLGRNPDDVEGELTAYVQRLTTLEELYGSHVIASKLKKIAYRKDALTAAAGLAAEMEALHARARDMPWLRSDILHKLFEKKNRLELLDRLVPIMDDLGRRYSEIAYLPISWMAILVLRHNNIDDPVGTIENFVATVSGLCKTYPFPPRYIAEAVFAYPESYDTFLKKQLGAFGHIRKALGAELDDEIIMTATLHLYGDWATRVESWQANYTLLKERYFDDASKSEEILQYAAARGWTSEAAINLCAWLKAREEAKEIRRHTAVGPELNQLVQYTQSLTQAECAAVSYVCDILLPESLVPDHLLDYEVLQGLLGVSDLQRHVMEVLIPKMQAAAAEGDIM